MHILFLTRHYPPEISGGARRPSLLVKGLRALGHKVTLVTPFAQDNDPDAILIKHPVNLSLGFEPKNNTPVTPKFGTRVKNHLRQWLLWPDADIRWARQIYKHDTILALKPDIIISSSPSESIHVAAQKLSKILHVPWVADFRDTWIQAPHRVILETSKLRRFGERRIAHKILSKASGLIAVSRFVQQDVNPFFSENTPTLILPHFSAPATQVYKFENPKKLQCLHSGGFSLSDRRRHLDDTLQVFAHAHVQNPALHLHITGPLSSAEKILASQHANMVTHHGQVPLATSIAMQAAADALILITPKKSEVLPGKFAEYSLTGRPIYYLGDGNWLDLVDNKSGLYPLETSLENLAKNDRRTGATALLAHEAVQHVSRFLTEVLDQTNL